MHNAKKYFGFIYKFQVAISFGLLLGMNGWMGSIQTKITTGLNDCQGRIPAALNQNQQWRYIRSSPVLPKLA